MISANIYRYVNYIDIQVLMMVIETETLTSALHHNKFTYLDYDFFLLPSYYRILIPIYFQTFLFGNSKAKYNRTRRLAWITSKLSIYMKIYFSLSIS